MFDVKKYAWKGREKCIRDVTKVSDVSHTKPSYYAKLRVLWQFQRLLI